MKKSIIVASLLLIAFPTFAYNPIKAEPKETYESIAIEGDPYIQREYLGNLEDFPDMYELTTDVSITLKVQLRQRASDDAVPFGVIMVRQNDADGGVSEVVRMNEPLTEWNEVNIPSLGMTFLEGGLIEKDIAPGTYRIEVSTPDNKGDYMLVVGDEAQSSGFFKAIGQIYVTQRHFGYTPFHLLFSSYVYYPIGILLVLYGIYGTWQYRRGETPWLVQLLKRWWLSRS
jgi:hypothetical protein